MIAIISIAAIVSIATIVSIVSIASIASIAFKKASAKLQKKSHSPKPFLPYSLFPVP